MSSSAAGAEEHSRDFDKARDCPALAQVLAAIRGAAAKGVPEAPTTMKGAAAAAVRGVRSVGRLATDHLDADVAIVAPALLGEHAARLLDDQLGAVPALGHRLAPAQHEDRRELVAVGEGRGDLVGVGRRPALGARHAHAVLADLLVASPR